MANKKEVLYGYDAVQRVANMEGRDLSIPEMMVIEEEGFVNKPYKDTKGITTYGVGQTGQWINKPFSAAFAAHEEDARRLIPSYDSLPDPIKGAIMSAAYRGDLQGSPTFRKLFNAGDYEAAAAEFLDNKDYRKSLKEGTGVAGRMERVAQAVRDFGQSKADEALYQDQQVATAEELQGGKNWWDKLFSL